MKKKRNRRSESAEPDLDPKLNLKRRADLYDQDYIHKLSPKERAWLNKFNREYVTDTVDRDNPKRNLHKTKKLIKDCDDRNNARNRDVLTLQKAQRQILYIDDLNDATDKEHYEDYLIEEIDKKDVRQAVEWLADELKKDEQSLEDRLISESKKESSED